jgi:hypothetical protein
MRQIRIELKKGDPIATEIIWRNFIDSSDGPFTPEELGIENAGLWYLTWTLPECGGVAFVFHDQPQARKKLTNVEFEPLSIVKSK